METTAGRLARNDMVGYGWRRDSGGDPEPMGKTARSQAYGGYFSAGRPRRPDAELLETGPGTAAGEYLRKFWHPVCLSSELADLPLAVRHLGEDLVLFRDKSGRLGALHRHCPHRGASLEYGVVSERGLRCCYHGWLFDVDGAVLDTPGEPPESRLKDSFRHGAYPAREYRGLVFAYLGPPDREPGFPIYDAYLRPDEDLAPYSIRHSCNWLHVQENIMDPAHIVFLHSRNNQYQLSPRMDVMPEIEFRETDGGHGCLYVTSRRLGDLVWVRCIHALLPGFFQAGALFEQGDAEKLHTGSALTRWTVPVDDTHCMIFGYRHFSEALDPHGLGKPEDCGKERVDFAPGQTMHRDYEEMQRDPGDWEVLVSQGPLPDHGREHLGRTDTGVTMMRRQFRRALRGESEPDLHLPPNGWDARATYTFDSVLRIPPANGDDGALVAEAGRRATDIVLAAREPPGPDRDRAIAKRIEAMKEDLSSGRTQAGASRTGNGRSERI